MKIEKLKNNILNTGKKLSITTIISTILTYISALVFYAIEHSGVSLTFYLSDIFTIFFFICFYGSVFVLSIIFIMGVVLTCIVAFKNHNPKEFLNSNFLIILTGILLPLGLILPLL